MRSILVAIASSERATAYLNRYAPAPEEPEAIKPTKKGKKKKSKEPEVPLELEVFFTKFPGMLWMLPWDGKRNQDWQFRCFIHRKKLRAISQWAWDRDLRSEGVKWAQPEVVQVWADAISKAAWILVKRLCYGDKSEPESLTKTTSFRSRRDTEIVKAPPPEESILPDNFTLDVLVRETKVCGSPPKGTMHEKLKAVNCDATLETVQVKPFGAQFDVGSCVYHWLRDYNTLVYGMKNGEAIEFRFVADVDPFPHGGSR